MVYDALRYPISCSNVNERETTGYEVRRQNSRWLQESRHFFQIHYPNTYIFRKSSVHCIFPSQAEYFCERTPV